MLYCVPKSLQVVWNFGRKHYSNVVKPIPYFEIPLFMVGGAILVSGLKQDLNSTYFNLLKFVVGSSNSLMGSGNKTSKKKGDDGDEQEDSQKQQQQQTTEEEND
jgi:hypothetical protein